MGTNPGTTPFTVEPTDPAPAIERRRSERQEYTNLRLIKLLRGVYLTDRELLDQRFQLARQLVRLTHSDAVENQDQRERDALRLSLEACEDECRERGLLRLG